MNPYIPITPDEENEMLDAIGIKTLEDLFLDIPKDIRVNESMEIGTPMTEPELLKYINSIAKKNKSLDDFTCFLGAGMYDHYIPSIVNHIISKPEFYTAYTPYQAEISQGTLQAIFEYQTMICNLTGMDVSNASMYDGATACAEAAKMAADATHRKSIIVDSTVNPEVRKVLKTYMRFHGIELIELDDNRGSLDIDNLKTTISTNTAAVIVQNPNFFGIIEDLMEAEEIIHKNKSLLIMYVEPISLSILKTPGEIGADIAVGDGQPLGNRLNFGGPHFGFMAVTNKLMRKMPGRIIGETTDVDGKRGFVLTLQAREQHIRREKATSNICTNNSLNALAAAVYMTALGKNGIKEVALHCLNKAHYAYDMIIKTGKFEPMFNGKPFFMEFAVKSPISIDMINNLLMKKNILGGYNLEKEYKKYKNTMLLCVTEKRTKEEIDNLVKLMEGIA